MSLPIINNMSNSTVSDSVIFTDTSFLWESHGTSNGNTPSRQAEAHNFSTNAISNNSVFVLSPIIEHELRNVAIKELLKHHARLLGLRNFQRKEIISRVPGFMESAHNQVNDIMRIINEDPNFIILDKDASQANAATISQQYNMDLNDAIILATMLENEINSIVTLDGDYIEVHDRSLNIYTNHLNYLKIIRDSPDKVRIITDDNSSVS